MGVDEEGVAHEMQDIVCQSRDLSAWVVRHHNSVVRHLQLAACIILTAIPYYCHASEI